MSDNPPNPVQPENRRKTRRGLMIAAVVVLIAIVIFAAVTVNSLFSSGAVIRATSTHTVSATNAETAIPPSVTPERTSAYLETAIPPTAINAETAVPPTSVSVPQTATMSETAIEVSGNPGNDINPQSLAFIVVSKSGTFLGQGVAKVYAPSVVAPNTSFVVKLELSFEALAITATPISNVTLVPVVEPTNPENTTETLTPTSVAEYAEHGIDIYQLMGASLSCSASSFSGCTDKPPTVINPGKIPAWTWELYSLADASGDQALTIKLLTYNQVNGTDVTDVNWQHSFTISVGQVPPPASTTGTALFVAAIVIAVLFLAVILILVLRRIRPSSNGSKVRGFVSYRRSVSWGVARTLYDYLSKRGADLFIDVEGLHEGRFGEAIQQEIAKREFFLVIISPTTFDSEWVIKEVVFALTLGKRIIPVCVDGFDIYKSQIPDEIKEIRNFNAVILTPEALEAGIERIAAFMNLRPGKVS